MRKPYQAHEFKKRPKGSVVGGYRRARVQIGFEKEMMDRIAALAKANNRSFAAQVRVLVENAIYLELRR
jgi:hypothetical protein